MTIKMTLTPSTSVETTTSMKMQEKQRKQIYNNQPLQQSKIGQNNDNNTSKTLKTTTKSIKYHYQNASYQPV
jgi:hypothetical protein